MMSRALGARPLSLSISLSFALSLSLSLSLFSLLSLSHANCLIINVSPSFATTHSLLQIAPAKHVNAPNGMPLVAWHEGNFQNKWKQPCPDKQQSIYRRAYYTSVSFTDGNVGEILAELKALGLYDSTVVSLIGDHGWQLGEVRTFKMLCAFLAPL